MSLVRRRSSRPVQRRSGWPRGPRGEGAGAGVCLAGGALPGEGGRAPPKERSRRPKAKGQKAYSTRYSQAVSHPSTNQARPCLASEIRRDRARSGWYGRRRQRLPLGASRACATPPEPSACHCSSALHLPACLPPPPASRRGPGVADAAPTARLPSIPGLFQARPGPARPHPAPRPSIGPSVRVRRSRAAHWEVGARRGGRPDSQRPPPPQP